MKNIGKLKKGDSIYRIFPEFKRFIIKDIHPSSDFGLIRFKIKSKDESKIFHTQVGISPLIRINKKGIQIYSTNPNFRYFYEKDRRSKVRRLLLVDHSG